MRRNPFSRARIMDRRSFTGGLAFATMAVEVMAEDPQGSTDAAGGRARADATERAGAMGAMAGVGPEWIGAQALAGGKGYADCPLGQVHYRMTGAGAQTPFLLIHQTPIGLAEYIDVQPALAQAGRRSIASDNPGYGSSDPVAGVVTLAALADNLRALCDHLHATRVIVVGHHTGAALAASLAARHPALVAGVVLHGTPLYDAGERAVRLARPPANLDLRADGAHFTGVFQSVGQWAGIDALSLSSITWATLGTFLAGADSPVYKAVFGHDLALDLAAIRAPTLILSDRSDVLYANDQRALRLRPDFEHRVFSEGGSFALMREPQRWAQVLLGFAVAHGL